jgi:DNA-binding MarR family transcriptional regulator
VAGKSQPGKYQEEEASLHIIRTADLLLQRLAQFLKPHNLSPTQYNVLRILRGAGKEGASCKDVGNRLLARDPDITRLMDRLETRGLLTRGRAGQDRRIVTHALTENGLALVNALDRPIERLNREFMRELSPAKLKTLIAILEQIRIAS